MLTHKLFTAALAALAIVALSGPVAQGRPTAASCTNQVAGGIVDEFDTCGECLSAGRIGLASGDWTAYACKYFRGFWFLTAS